MPPLGELVSLSRELAQQTRTELEGDEEAVDLRMGWRSVVKRKGPRQLVAIWSSWPCWDISTGCLLSRVEGVEKTDLSTL
jgi:hypothetical protein